MNNTVNYVDDLRVLMPASTEEVKSPAKSFRSLFDWYQIKGYTVLYFAVEDGNATTANVTLENGSVNQTILSGLRKYTQYSIQILFFFFNFL